MEKKHTFSCSRTWCKCRGMQQWKSNLRSYCIVNRKITKCGNKGQSNHLGDEASRHHLKFRTTIRPLYHRACWPEARKQTIGRRPTDPQQETLSNRPLTDLNRPPTDLCGRDERNVEPWVDSNREPGRQKQL